MYILGKQMVAPLINQRKNSNRYMFFPQVLKDNIDLHIASTVSIEQPIDSPSIHSIDLITSTEPIHYIDLITSNEPNSSIESNSFIEPTPVSSITTNTWKKSKKRCYLCPRTKDRKVTSTCYYCEFIICVVHSDQYFVCDSCKNEYS